MYVGVHVEYRYSCQILIKLEFLNRFSKHIQISNFMKNRSGTKGFACGHTDVTKPVVAFRNFFERAVKWVI
jgi:hypothetical protein